MDDAPTHIPRVVYEYVVNGRVYSSTQLNIGFERGYGKWQEAADVLDDYPVGLAVTVYYDPANPANTVLHPNSTNNNIALYAGIGALTLGVIAVIVTLWLKQGNETV